jgi:hypothetical protein
MVVVLKRIFIALLGKYGILVLSIPLADLESEIENA